jgi:hypothetical protein
MRPRPVRFQARPETPAALFPYRGICYNRRAVERAAKQQLAQVPIETAHAAVQSAASSEVSLCQAARTEDASRYCPLCSTRLESRRCKLIGSLCGYYMSCADYY